MDAYALLGVAGAVGLLPSMVAATLMCARYVERRCKPSSELGEDEKPMVTAHGRTVKLIELRNSRLRLRFGITYSTMQLGWSSGTTTATHPHTPGAS